MRLVVGWQGGCVTGQGGCASGEGGVYECTTACVRVSLPQAQAADPWQLRTPECEDVNHLCRSQY